MARQARRARPIPSQKQVPDVVSGRAAAIVQAATHAVSAASLGLMAAQMVRIWWSPGWDTGGRSGFGLLVWVVEFFFLLATMLVVAISVMRSTRDPHRPRGRRLDEGWEARVTQLVPWFFLLLFCVGGGTAVVLETSGDPVFAWSYLGALALRIGMGLAEGWLAGRDADVSPRVMRWGLSVGLFLVASFAGILVDWPAGVAVPTGPGRGIFERHPEAALGAMTLYFSAQAVVELLSTAARVRALARR